MSNAPESLEVCPCPLCGARGGAEVAQKVRFGYPRTTRCCQTCATLYQSPRRQSSELSAAYPQERAHDLARTSLMSDEGPLLPDDSRFPKAHRRRAETRALNAIQLSGAQAGDTVLELGCGSGLMLAAARELFDITPYGVDPDAALQPALQQQGIPCGVQSLDELDPRGLDFDVSTFDRIVLVGMLQRVPDPLALLLRCRAALSPGGRVVVETTNALQPYGSLQGNFFQRQDLTTFSLSTLTALFKRAGFVVQDAFEGTTLYIVASPDNSIDEALLPLPFSATQLGASPETCDYIATCLATYSAMEALRLRIKQEGPDIDALHGLVHQLMRPAFMHHVVDCVLDLVDFFMGYEALGLACLVATAASEGPYPDALRSGLDQLAQSIRAAAQPGAPSEELQQATEREMRRDSPTVQTAIEALRHELIVDGTLGAFPQLPVEQSDKRPANAS